MVIETTVLASIFASARLVAGGIEGAAARLSRWDGGSNTPRGMGRGGGTGPVASTLPPGPFAAMPRIHPTVGFMATRLSGESPKYSVSSSLFS